MPGEQRCGAELLGPRHEVGELDRLVAPDARNRRLAAQIAVGEIVDHRLAESRFEIEDVVRDAELRRDASRIMNVLPGAAAPCELRLA